MIRSYNALPRQLSQTSVNSGFENRSEKSKNSEFSSFDNANQRSNYFLPNQIVNGHGSANACNPLRFQRVTSVFVVTCKGIVRE